MARETGASVPARLIVVIHAARTRRAGEGARRVRRRPHRLFGPGSLARLPSRHIRCMITASLRATAVTTRRWRRVRGHRSEGKKHFLGLSLRRVKLEALCGVEHLVPDAFQPSTASCSLSAILAAATPISARHFSSNSPSFSASCLTSLNMRSSIGNVAGCRIESISATKFAKA